MDVLVKRVDTRCQHCETPLSAMTADALTASMREHASYIIATRDPQTDPHFEDARRDALLA